MAEANALVSSRVSRARASATGLVDVPIVVAWQGHGDELQVESACDRPGQDRQGLLAVGDHEHVSTEIEQSRQFVAAVHGLPCPGLGLGRQVTGHEADGDEGEERRPVLRIRDV